MSYTPTVDSTDRYATVDIAGERFTYPVSTATIAGVAAPIRGNNLLKASNNFSDSSWTKTRSSISGTTLDVTLDSGEVVTMQKLVEDGTAGATHMFEQTAIGGNPINTHVLTFLLLTASNTRRVIPSLWADSASNSVYAVVNPDLGAVVSTGVTGTSVLDEATITAVGTHSGSTIYRVKLSGNGIVAATTLNRVRFELDNGTTSVYNGNSTSGVYIAQAQLTEGTEATTYQETSSQLLASGENLANTSVWTGSGVTVTGPVSGPTSELDAWTILTIAGSSQFKELQQNFTSVTGLNYYFEAYLKPSGYTYAQLIGTSATIGTFAINVDLTNSTIYSTTAGTSTVVSSGASAAGNGFTKVWAVLTAIGAGTARISVDIIPAVGSVRGVTWSANGTSGIIAYRPMITAGSVATIWSDFIQPRISGDGQRLTHSGDLSNAAWTKTNVTGVSAGSIAYTNAATLDTGEVLSMAGVYETTANAVHEFFQTSDVPANANLTASFIVKKQQRDYFGVYIINTSALTDFILGRYRFSTDTVDNLQNGGTGSGVSITSEDLGDGAIRITVKGKPSTAAGVARLVVYVLSDAGGTPYTGDTGKGIYIAEPIIVAGSTAPSYTRSYADRLAPGGSTRDRAYVLIPHIDDFDAAGIHIGTRWNTEQEWILTDGTDTATSTEQIAPPDADAFDSVGVGPYEHAPDGVTPGDDGYMHLLTGAGTFTTSAYGFAPTENSTFRSMAYSVVDAEWLAGFDTSEDFSTPPSPPDESLWVAVKYIVTNVVQEIT